jgi:predicted PhzF superfamily epimerase YddE/YHI9
VLLPSAAHVLNTKPNFAVLKGVDFGLVGPYPAGSPHAYEVRGFSFVDGPTEDPVTGSLNAGMAQLLMGSGRAPAQYVAAQGTVLGRSGRVHLARAADGRIWVGGRSHTLVSGHVQL